MSSSAVATGFGVRLISVFANVLRIAPLRSRAFWLALGSLFVVDLAFVIAHLLWASDATVELLGQRIYFGEKHRISFTIDHSYGELWEGIKGLSSAALFLGCFLYH